ncbi:hypothetical protein AC579_10321 [Pseudocercospora musae]|uniref:Uncharacterized protein n=1 Tax=Pseudocercospora musae TaxID=113226 RepID=A0A139H667_9PEZI|nr:hypothetical protein AC579_10321 [Pseudocercospora musae]
MSLNGLVAGYFHEIKVSDGAHVHGAHTLSTPEDDPVPVGPAQSCSPIQYHFLPYREALRHTLSATPMVETVPPTADRIYHHPPPKVWHAAREIGYGIEALVSLVPSWCNPHLATAIGRLGALMHAEVPFYVSPTSRVEYRSKAPATSNIVPDLVPIYNGLWQGSDIVLSRLWQTIPLYGASLETEDRPAFFSRSVITLSLLPGRQSEVNLSHHVSDYYADFHPLAQMSANFRDRHKYSSTMQGLQAMLVYGAAHHGSDGTAVTDASHNTFDQRPT